MTRPVAFEFRSASTLRTLPVFSLWKNTDTQGQGYVTGLEPGTSFSYNRRYQRPLNLVPTIGPRTQAVPHQLRLLADKAAVDKALKQVSEIQAGRGELRCGRRRWLI